MFHHLHCFATLLQKQVLKVYLYKAESEVALLINGAWENLDSAQATRRPVKAKCGLVLFLQQHTGCVAHILNVNLEELTYGGVRWELKKKILKIVPFECDLITWSNMNYL